MESPARALPCVEPEMGADLLFGLFGGLSSKVKKKNKGKMHQNADLPSISSCRSSSNNSRISNLESARGDPALMDRLADSLCLHLFCLVSANFRIKPARAHLCRATGRSISFRRSHARIQNLAFWLASSRHCRLTQAPNTQRSRHQSLWLRTTLHHYPRVTFKTHTHTPCLTALSSRCKQTPQQCLAERLSTPVRLAPRPLQPHPHADTAHQRQPSAPHHPHPRSETRVESRTLLRHHTNHHRLHVPNPSAPCLHAHPRLRSLKSLPPAPKAALVQLTIRVPPLAFAPPLRLKATNSPTKPSPTPPTLLPMPKSPASGTTAAKRSTACNPSSTICTTSTSASTRASTCANGPAASARANRRRRALRSSAT